MKFIEDLFGDKPKAAEQTSENKAEVVSTKDMSPEEMTLDQVRIELMRLQYETLRRRIKDLEGKDVSDSELYQLAASELFEEYLTPEERMRHRVLVGLTVRTDMPEDGN